MAEGHNEIAVTTRFEGVEGPPSVVEVTHHPDATIGLDGVSPERGPPGAVVTLTGSGFGADPEAVEVFFRAAPFEGTEELDVPAPVLEASDTRLRVAVPFGILDGGEASVFVVVGGRISSMVSFRIEPAVDPTPETGGNEAEAGLQLVAEQVRTLRGTLEQLAGDRLAEDARDALLGNLDRMGTFLQTLRDRLATVPDPEVRTRLDAILGSEVLAGALEQLNEANRQLRRLAQRAALRAQRGLPDAGVPGCEVAEVVDALQRTLRPVRVVAGVLHAAKDTLYGMLVGASIGCAFGVVPACAVIPVLAESVAVISTVTSVLDAILSVVDYVADALFSAVPAFPSEWKVVLDQPIPGLANDVLYTGTTDTLTLYVN
ncbi:MAG: hypothetical protein D6708_13370, partial [Candidatus Dadabacteria bacterium]